MSLSSIIKQECPSCGKQAIEASRLKIGSTTLIKLVCGHLISEAVLTNKSNQAYENIIFSDGCKPRPYQIDGIKFFEENSLRGVLADEQGLGKTIQCSSLFRLHYSEILPAILVVPASVKVQWLHELRRICCDERGFKDPRFLTQIIQSKSDKALPGFQIYIVTYDMLKSEEMFSLVEDDVKTLVLDECQRIKNHLSERAKAVQRVGKKVKHILAMSGTPIKNNAGEYFTVLNLVAPRRFPQYEKFIREYCDSYETMYGYKVGGLRKPEWFHEDTKDIILRRTKAEVLKDLPALERKFFHAELDRKLNKAYDAALKELEEMMYDDSVSEFQRSSNTIAIMSKMRHITGIGKVQQCIDFTTEFLLSNDRKIVIFVHHQDVATLIQANLDKWCEDGNFGKPLMLHSGLNGDDRQKLVMRFKNESSSRIMIASTQAAGEGLNLQFCSDAIMLERQWNPANEEQAEGRFHRFGQENNVTVTYMIASGTIDEYFTELVEQKRAIVAAAMDNKSIEWNQQSLMKELAETLVVKGRKSWSL